MFMICLIVEEFRKTEGDNMQYGLSTIFTLDSLLITPPLGEGTIFCSIVLVVAFRSIRRMEFCMKLY